MSGLAEVDVETAALEWLGGLGWEVVCGPRIAPETSEAEHGTYGGVFLAHRLRVRLP